MVQQDRPDENTAQKICDLHAGYERQEDTNTHSEYVILDD